MIWKAIPLLAQSSSAPMTAEDLRAAAPPTKLPGLHINDMLTVIAATLLVVALVVIWAVFIRKPGGDRTRVYKSRPTEEITEDGMIRKRKRHKKQRREHRQRNPTLSQAGGLPPVKTDNSVPPI